MHLAETTKLTQVGFQVEIELVEDFDRVAHKNNRSRSAELRHVMQRHVAANRRKLEPEQEETAA